METLLYVKFIAAFVFVIALMLLLPWVMKKMGISGQSIMAGNKRRLKVVEYLSLDHRRRLLLVRRDDQEHLIILGPQGETVVETHIAVPADDAAADVIVKENNRAQA